MNETTRGYAIAVGTTGFAFLVRWLLNPQLNNDARLLVFSLSVIGTALWGGFLPGLLATALGTILGAVFFFPNHGGTPNEATHILIFLAIGISVSFMARAVAQARRQAEASELYLSSIVEATGGGLLVLDPSGYITFANPAAARLFGLMPSHLIGRRYDDAGWGMSTWEGVPLPPEDQPAARALRDGASVTEAHVAIRSADDTLVPLHVNCAPIRDAEGAVSAVVVSLHRSLPSGS